MAAVASLRAIRTAGIDPDEIDLILLATLTPDYWMPSTAALVKEAIGNKRAAAMDVAAACSGFVYAFATAQAAVAAVSEAMSGLDDGPIRIRVGIHTGTPALDPPKYIGIDVHRAARIMSAAHGGQVVLRAGPGGGEDGRAGGQHGGHCRLVGAEEQQVEPEGPQGQVADGGGHGGDLCRRAAGAALDPQAPGA